MCIKVDGSADPGRGVATERVITEQVDGAGVGHDVSQRNGWSRAPARGTTSTRRMVPPKCGHRGISHLTSGSPPAS